MSAKKSGDFFIFPLFSATSFTSRSKYSLAAHQVKICKRGIEFLSDKKLDLWTELKIDLQSARDDRQIQCCGVVVSCTGNRSAGYLISLLFTNLSQQSQEVLDSLKISF